jgi:hypothetical protein
MIEESLLKSNFIGRDGFRWWIGQIPPISAQGEQGNGGGWGNRVKVRIMGYHPHSEKDLSNEDLPWAQVLLPTTSGTGAANRAQNIKVQPGDIVFGFFMDGDNAQIPVILGCFGRTSEVSEKQYKNPFEPFTGYTNNIKNDGSKLEDDQTNEQNSESQKSPRSLPPDQVSKLNQAIKSEFGSLFANELSYFNAIGNKVVSANACNSTLAQSVMSEMENLIGRLKLPEVFTNSSLEIKRTVDKLQGMTNGFVGQMFRNVYTKLIPILQKGLELLYQTIFAYVYAITPGDPATKFAVAHAAGVLAQQAMLIPVKELEKGIPCEASKTVNSSYGLIEKLVKSFVENVDNYSECAGVEFTAALLNAIVSKMISALSPLLDAVTRILSPGFSLENLLRGSVSNYLGAGGAQLDCKQNKKKCSGLTGGFSIGSGNKKIKGNDIYKDILKAMNVGKKVGNAVKYTDRLPDEVIKAVESENDERRTTKITSKVTENDTAFKLRKVGFIKPGQVLATTKETMTVKSVDYNTHRVQVERKSSGISYKAGTKVTILGSLPSSAYGLSEDLSEFEKIIGEYGVFNGRSRNKNSLCYTGTPFNCTPPIAESFGGSGYGAVMRPLMGKFKMKKNGKITGSIIGVQVQNSGYGYRYPPYVQFVDKCNNGYGAIARTIINDSGRITGVYMVSTGENYPVNDVEEYELIDVIIEDGGSDYSPDTTVIDDLGNEYEVVIDDNGTIVQVTPINIIEVSDLPQIDIISETGSGAILKPVLNPIEYGDPVLPGPVPIDTQTEIVDRFNDEIALRPITAENYLVQVGISEQLPLLDPSIIRARERARLRRRLLQTDVKRVKDCPT